MIPIKIFCGCGQHYAFDVEAVDGRMPTAVACPACGTDGTDAANAIIAQTLSPQPTVTVSQVRAAGPAQSGQGYAPTSVGAAPAPASTPRGMASFMPKVDRSQAEHEAKAKILWGDPPDEAIKHLMLHGFTVDEASALVSQMCQERFSTIRANGIKKIIFGVVLICVPVVALVIFLSIGVIYIKILALTIMVGFYGAWLALKGCFMVLSPKSEQGDVSEQ